MRRSQIATFALWFLALSGVAFSQNLISNAQREQLASVPRGLSGDLLLRVRAFGSRFVTPGKEETVLTGSLVPEAGEPKMIQVVHQLSGLVRIEGLREQVTISFDGDRTWGSVDRTDESLVETFVMDTIEGLFYSARSGGAVKLLGRRFGPDPRSASAKTYKGPYYDIYEVHARVRSRQDQQIRLKRYYFDSDSGFLVSTRYTDPTVSKGVNVETRFSNWRQDGGSAYPGLIERYEDGHRIFSFAVGTVSGRPRQDATNFR